IPEIARRYAGLTPDLLIDLKALMGDSSDNIPGVAGVGEKTATDLISRFGSLDNIYENLDSLDIKDSLRQKLESGKEAAYLSRWLGTICREVPLNIKAEDLALKERDDSALAAALADIEFFKLIERMGLKAAAVAKAEKSDLSFRTVGAEELIANLGDEPLFICIDKESGIMGISAKDMAARIDRLSFGGAQLALDILADKSIRKCAADSKPLYKWCLENGTEAQNIFFDCALAGYILNPSASDYEIERLAAEYNVAAPQSEDAAPIKQAAIMQPLAKALAKAIEENGQQALLTKIELPLARVLADMEHRGFLVDVDGLIAHGQDLQQRINTLQAEIFDLVGWEFNLNSPKQLGVALFERLGLPCKKKTKSGYSTSAEVLEGLRDAHPAVSLLLEYRSLAKLKSTYCDGLTKAASKSGRIHSTLNQTETRTGRISSAEPNLQNIPVRTEEGRIFRKFFKSAEGCTLLDADYSQIELRVLAHMADDKAMIDAFCSGTDIHTVTASQVFGLPESMVTPILRSRAKAVNFGIVYGIGAFSLSKDIGVSVKEAAKYIDGYLATYRGVDSYMQSVVEKATADGYVSTIFGRRRMLPELSASNGMMRAFGERVARNMPIQGTAADIIKIAMVRVWERLREELPQAHLILQVHDELIVEAPDDCVEAAGRILLEEMEHAADLKVPLVVDMNAGKTWYQAKG
ncbi:MAG: DNA polymerase I, partial [Clostridia bacterium]|nr:DNA polymerase I [Clostridia bacterium]